MRIATLAFITIISFSGAAAQSETVKLEIQKSVLKRNLIKYAPNVYDVNYDGCSAIIKITQRAGSVSSYNSSGFVGGGFPRDEASNFLSAGPGNQIQREVTSTRFILRLSDLKSENIALIPPVRGKLSTIKIVDPDSSGTLGNIRKGVITLRNEIAIAVKEKNSNLIVQAFRSLVTACKTTK